MFQANEGILYACSVTRVPNTKPFSPSTFANDQEDPYKTKVSPPGMRKLANKRKSCIILVNKCAKLKK